MPKQHLEPGVFVGKVLPEHPEYTILRPLDEGLKGAVFVAHSDSLARDVACKVIPKENLIGPDQSPPAWRAEITNANQVASARVVKIFGFGTWSTNQGEYVYLLSDLVPGVSLRKYVATNRIDMGLLLQLAAELLDFVRELQVAHLTHGDLHDGNILIEDNTQALTGPPFRFRITDFGVAPATTGAVLRDDFEQLAVLLRGLLEKLDYQELLPQDRLLFEFFRDDLIAKRLTERDTTFDHAARDPRGIYEAVESARKRAVQQSGAVRRHLSTPFEYLSCEQLGEAHVLLKDLYSDKMLGLTAIEAVNNLVLTGPRGCGKTTVFRSLSLSHRVRTDDDAPNDVKYIGVYYRCDDLYYSFPRYSTPSRPEALDVPMHFLTVTLLRELLMSLGQWLERRAPLSWTEGESRASRDLWELLELSPPKTPSANTFFALTRALDRERSRAAKKQRFANDPSQRFGDYFGPDKLLRACELLSQHFAELSTRPIFFLIDDYSIPKISEHLQANLNRLTMQRGGACFFKIATESPVSFVSRDIDGKSYVEGREFVLVNLGMNFVNAEEDDKLRFVDDVFNKRLSYAESFPIRDLQTLVGDCALVHNETARELRGGQQPQVWGRSALAELCSGDVHFLIDLAGKMVIQAGGADALGTGDSIPAIPAATQTKTIKVEAGNFLKNLRALPGGDRLVEIVEAFGSVAASYVRHRDSKNEDGSPPHQASRIEPYEDPNLTGHAREIYNDLLRYSVFLEDVRGKSLRGLVVRRLYLRRFLIPFFRLTFSKRDSLPLSVDELRELLLDPKRFEGRKRLRGPGREPATESGQLPLIPRNPEEDTPS